MTKIDSPNYTQIPNDILGDIQRGNIVSPGLMATLEGSQLKVLLAICRLTFGFHQSQRRASIAMIREFTGLSKQGVINAANKLEEMGLIIREQDGGVTLWKVVVHSVDNQDNLGVNSVDQMVHSVDTHLRKKPINKPTLSIKGNKSKKITPAEIEYYNPLAQSLLSLCKLPVPLVNGTKLDFLGVMKFFNARKATPARVVEFGQWYGQTPTLKAITDNWGRFEAGELPPHKQYKQNGASKNGHSAGNKQTNAKTYRTGAELAAEPYYDPATNEHVFPDGHREPVGI